MVNPKIIIGILIIIAISAILGSGSLGQYYQGPYDTATYSDRFETTFIVSASSFNCPTGTGSKTLGNNINRWTCTKTSYFGKNDVSSCSIVSGTSNSVQWSATVPSKYCDESQYKRGYTIGGIKITGYYKADSGCEYGGKLYKEGEYRCTEKNTKYICTLNSWVMHGTCGVTLPTGGCFNMDTNRKDPVGTVLCIKQWSNEQFICSSSGAWVGYPDRFKDNPCPAGGKDETTPEECTPGAIISSTCENNMIATKRCTDQGSVDTKEYDCSLGDQVCKEFSLSSGVLIWSCFGSSDGVYDTTTEGEEGGTDSDQEYEDICLPETEISCSDAVWDVESCIWDESACDGDDGEDKEDENGEEGPTPEQILLIAGLTITGITGVVLFLKYSVKK